jgi:hypothetical protein
VDPLATATTVKITYIFLKFDEFETKRSQVLPDILSEGVVLPHIKNQSLSSPYRFLDFFSTLLIEK